MDTPLVVSVVLNTNRRDDTLACIASLTANDYARHHVLVLDNASTDGSVEALAAQFPAVEVHPLGENRGYAGNNNVGVRLALARGADWVFVLNEDTVLARDCIGALVAAGSSDPSVGIVGPMVYHADEPDVIQSAGGWIDRYWRAGHYGQNERDHGVYPAARPVDWISGCAILVRREVIEQVGALDERFFYFWEETEWCVRTRRAGWQILHVPTAHLWHKGVSRDYRPGPNVTYYDTRNHWLLMRTHRAPLTAWASTMLQVARTLASWTLRPRHRHLRAHRDAMWQGARDYLRGQWGQRPVRPEPR